jgi:hypothetical protein
VSKQFPVRIADGGNLLTQPAVSLENVGENNFTQITNWRRNKDQLQRREGWLKFEPVTGASQYIFDGTELVLKLAELIRPNGERVIVGVSRTLIKKFDVDTGTWTTIGSGYSAGGLRWQTITMNGFLVMNNGVDLPVSYRVEDATVTPIYEMREVGIASVGRIAEYNGFFFVADIVEVQDVFLNQWMNGFGSYVASSTVAKVASFAVVSGDSHKQFDVTTGGVDMIATLPDPVADPTFWIWIRKADAGVGIVSTSPETAGDAVALAAIGDIALVWSDGARYVSKVFAGGVIPATSPYGLVPASITNHLPYAVAWSDYGEPTHWAPLFDVYMPAASTTLNLPFPTNAFIPNKTRVAVIGGGPDGGTLGGQSTTPNGVLVTAVVGNAITIEETTDITNIYPRTVQVTRWSDVSTFVGRALLQGDGSRITGMLALQGQLMIYRETGIYTCRFTGDATAPFTFKPIYSGYNVPMWGDCIASPNGEFHVYPGIGRRFYQFDGATEPAIYAKCDDARNLFFDDSLLDSAECFALDSVLTKEAWFCRPGKVMALDIEFQTVSGIDAQIDAGTIARRPGGVDTWWVIGIGKNIYTYGLVNGVDSIHTWLRDGVVAVPVLKSGLNSMGEQTVEKDILNYTPLLGSPSPDAALEVQIASTWNPSQPPVDLLNPVAELPTPQGDNFIALLYRGIYFQDTITVTDQRDIDVRISARLWEVDYLRAPGVPRLNI